jgi:hypothetical protein
MACPQVADRGDCLQIWRVAANILNKVARMGEESNVYKVLMGKSEGKRPLGTPRHRWEDGIRMDLRQIGWGNVQWPQMTQDRDRWWALVNTVMNLRVLALHS